MAKKASPRTKKSTAPKARTAAPKKAAGTSRRTTADAAARTRRATASAAPAEAETGAVRVRRKRAVAPAPTPAVRPEIPTRRAVFIDVENTSSEDDLTRVLDHLQLDRRVQPTELWALGNWKSVGVRVARMLAALGAQLMHSAPSPGVRDWSDLRIAVAAGYWLATARAGDRLDIVSDDKAFDAVGDAAAIAGVVFVRTSYRSLHAAPRAAAVVEPAEPRRRRGRRGGRSRRGGSPVPGAPMSRHVPLSEAEEPRGEAPGAPASAAPISDEEHHAASHQQIRATLERLTGGSDRWVNLDLLANTLRNEGFVRPAGSPRLIVRLRRIKDVEVSPNGMIRLAAAAAPAAAAEPTAVAATEVPAESPPTPATKPRRRGGTRRPRRAAARTAGTPAADVTPA